MAVNGEADIWCGALQIIKRYGEDAPLEAAMRADAMLEAGDLDGLAVWKLSRDERGKVSSRMRSVNRRQPCSMDGRLLVGCFVNCHN